jgi:hypothetical protein
MKLWLSLLLCALGSVEVRADSGTSALLAPDFGLEADARALRQGRVVARVVDATGGSEVVTIAAVHVDATAAAFRTCAERPSCLLGHDELLGAARVNPASADEDLGALQLDAHDRQHLERCRVGKCGVRLSAAAIERFRTEVDWKGRDAAPQASALFRKTLAEIVRSYAGAGEAGLGTYQDNERGTSVAAALEALFARPLPPLSLAPDLRRQPRPLPASPTSGDDYLCWRQERFWMQNLVTLEHVALEQTANGTVVVLVKQLYASHYFDAELSAFAFEPDPAGGGLLLQMNRASADVRPSGFTWVERMLVNRLVRGRLVRHLGALRERIDNERLAEATHSTR